MEAEGPFPHFQLIFCRDDEEATSKIAAFPDTATASEHARLRLLAMPDEWISVVLALIGEVEIEFLGAWDRDHEGSVRWEDASLA